MLTSTVFVFNLLLKSSKSIKPSLFILIKSTSKPLSCNDVAEDIIELCSKLPNKICFPLVIYLSVIPLITKLFDSVAPLVYIISSVLHSKYLHIFLVAVSITSFDCLPSL